MVSYCKRKAISLISFLILMVSCTCLAQDSSQTAVSLKDAVFRLEQFRKDVESMRSVVEKPLGPYSFTASCSWCCGKFLWWCTKDCSESWGMNVDFQWTRTKLHEVLDSAEKNFNTFPDSFAPVQAWINGLPGFSDKFDSTATSIINVRNEIAAGKGPDEKQRLEIAQALDNLIDALESNVLELRRGTTALAAFLQNQSAFRSDIKTAIDGADRSAQEALTDLQKQSMTQRCQNGVQENFNKAKNDFSQSTREIWDAFIHLETSSKEAEKSLAFLLGTVVSSLTDMHSVLESLRSAKKDEFASFMEKLHFDVAQRQWRELAASASQMLAKK